MLELHIWGKDRECSIISPESFACVWFLYLHFGGDDEEVKIVPSCNTNISDTGRLPVLIEDNEHKYHGYSNITEHVITKYKKDSSGVADDSFDKHDQLVNKAIINLIETSLDGINQFNLYILSRNYEDYTRKLFKGYLPFPMMYNQPLKFYNHAQNVSEHLGISAARSGMLDFVRSGSEVAQTEYVNDDVDDEDAREHAPISSLHEKQILIKRREKELMKEGQYIMRCAQRLETFLSHIYKLKKSFGRAEIASFILDNERISSSELLLFAYIKCLTSPSLPNRFISQYLETKHAPLVEFASQTVQLLEGKVDSAHSFFIETPYSQRPTLVNELKYKLDIVHY